MEGRTHIIGGVAAGLGLATVSQFDPVLVTGAAALGAIVPDICHTGSKIGRKLPLLSKTVSMIFGHRTFTHSLLFLGLAAWLMLWLPIHLAIVAGILVGMASHLILDAVTKNGIKLFYPLPITFRIPLYIRTGGAVEQFVAVGLIVLCIYWGLEVFGEGVR